MNPPRLSRYVSPHVLILGLLLGLFSLQGGAMAFFSKKEVVLSSPMEGRLTYQGEPVSGATLTRELRWQSDEPLTDFTKTDKSGYFRFEGVKDSWRKLLPAEFVVYQDIYVQYDEEAFQIWVMSKREEGLWGELGGKPVNLRCELTDELERVELHRGLLGTSCRWDSIEDKERDHGVDTEGSRTVG